MASVSVVFDTETSPQRPVPLGEHIATDEDVVIYTSPCGGRKQAPVDCVTVVAVDVRG